MAPEPIFRVVAPVLLYRCKTPTDRLCACGRVARALAPRGIGVDEVRVPWRRADREDVAALTGQTTAIFGDEAICDSRRILEHLAWRDDERERAGSVAPP
jgi:hypothetical protein